MSPNVNAIVKQLEAASNAYYNTGTSIMSDAEFDVLVQSLRDLDPKNAFLATIGAPPPNSLFKPVKHQIPMGSQEKVKNFEELSKWFAKLPHKEVVIQWKYDGASISLEYKNGKLVRAVSRGDGITGEDVTQNILRSPHIVKQLKLPFTGFIRGEVLLYKEDFKKYFPDGSNPRNQGNGIMRSKDGEGCEHLRVMAYDVVVGSASKIERAEHAAATLTESDKLQWLKMNGFDQPLKTVLVSAVEIQDAHDGLGKAREGLPFEVDGIVIKLNNVAAAEAMGESDSRPKAQRAYKWEALGAVTVVTSIEWTVGHTGAVVPTFKVEERNIGGTRVGSVLMNNIGYCEAMDVAVGDQVYVTRRGDVIPHIETVISRPKSRSWAPPSKCPVCEERLVRKEIHLVCPNTNCPGQKVRLIRRWLTALDIKFIGPEIEMALWESGLVQDPADLYTLTMERLANLTVGNGRLGEDRAGQILDEIDKSRKLELHQFMGALGIQFLGVRAAKHMVEDNGFDTIEKFSDPKLIRTGMSLGAKKSLGPVVREAVAAGVEANLPLIKRLLRFVKLEAHKKVERTALMATGKAASGKSFCFTGALPSGMGRNEAQGLVASAGGIVHDHVSKTTNFLVIADPSSNSSKANKARALGVTLISEAQFKEMV